ncbi:hypothetical protein PN462_01675 [Spirulina sp. CS-785/01]|uniref:hypothetical protein n=1 Tax=Spirulina sp. CS-785/01 TaxID=3021716 RepID=UPI00232A9F49|nr:hypothetical protein [Spirulina sp. CS-785/01]MDB9311794.1 hypothetical protein [Spirulina sp. CS-785/01]
MKKTITQFIQQNWELWISLLCFAGILFLFLIQSLQQNQGHLVYALDDAYIHMAIAKNLAQHSLWGVTPFEFSAASSSILWTLLLAFAYKIFGISEPLPLILNIIFAIGIITVFYFYLKQYNQNSLFLISSTLLLIIITPLPTLVFTGMEHTLQVLLVFLFVYILQKVLKTPQTNTPFKLLLFLTLLLALTRYEHLLLITTTTAVFAFFHQLKRGLSLLVILLTAWSIFGVYFWLNGSYFLPNSVLVKNPTLDFDFWTKVKSLLGGQLIFTLSNYPAIWLLIVIGLTLLILNYPKSHLKDSKQIILLIALITTILHIQWARIGWLFRYEAYFIALNWLAISTSLSNYIPRKINRIFNLSLTQIIATLSVILLIVTSPLMSRGRNAFTQSLQATTNIYEQQYQMGQFVQKYYQGEAIVAHDIGAISYLGNPQLLDVAGLGTNEITGLIINQKMTDKILQQLAQKHNSKIAVIYESNIIPSQWEKVGEWQITNNVIALRDTVIFYAVDPQETQKLITNLQDYSQHLPDTVQEKGEYTQE